LLRCIPATDFPSAQADVRHNNNGLFPNEDYNIPYSPVREGRPNRIKNARVYKQAAVFLFFSGLPALVFLPGLALLVAQLLNMECFVREYWWRIIKWILF